MEAIKLVKARKEYKCNITKKTISIKEEYKRVNIRNLGIFHFKNEISNKDIKDYIDKKLNSHLINCWNMFDWDMSFEEMQDLIITGN